MPYIRVYAYSGRDIETKKKAAAALVKTASEVMGAPESAFTVSFEDIEREDWERDVKEAVIDTIRDKVFIDHGAVADVK